MWSLFFDTVVFLCIGVSKGVRGFPEVEGSLGDPKGLRGASGVSKWVNRDVRCVMGSRGTPRGSRGIRGVVKVSQGMKRGVPGVKGSLGDAKGLRGTSGEY